jgi:uncharacterized protein with HEPN domain
MKRSARPHMTDILEAVQEIEKTVHGFSFETYRASWQVRRAVERGLEIISEASRHIPDELKRQLDEIPWQQIAGIGNVLRHEYHRVDDLIVWNIVQEHLPQLKMGIMKLLAHLSTRNE